ncbi:MAG: hypothetical protein ACE5JD_15340 [Candidatus Methylomirabilia bacterium]
MTVRSASAARARGETLAQLAGPLRGGQGADPRSEDRLVAEPAPLPEIDQVVRVKGQRV